MGNDANQSEQALDVTKVRSFLNELRAARICPASTLEQVEQAWQARVSEDSTELAKALVEQAVITRYQAAAIYQGKTKTLLLGDWVIHDHIGSGGMGRVYRAQRRTDGMIAAVKVLSSKMAKSNEGVQRFQREAQIAARLAHPNIVRILDIGNNDHQHFFAMEYLEGLDLGRWTKRFGPMNWREAIHNIIQAAQALEFAHSKGVIHRDIKPGNLLLTNNNVLKVLDLGLASLDESTRADEQDGDEALTQTGQVLGTLDYMAPEQALSTRSADARSDIYSLGCTLYRIATGRRPFVGESVVQKIVAHREQVIPSLRPHCPGVPLAVDEVLSRALAKRPEDRQLSMGDFARELERAVSVASPQVDDFRPIPPPAAKATPAEVIPFAKPVPLPTVASVGRVTNTVARSAKSRLRFSFPLLAIIGSLAFALAVVVHLVNQPADSDNPPNDAFPLPATGLIQPTEPSPIEPGIGSENIVAPQQPPKIGGTTTPPPAAVATTAPLLPETMPNSTTIPPSTSNPTVPTTPAPPTTSPSGTPLASSTTMQSAPTTPVTAQPPSPASTLNERRRVAIFEGLKWLAANQDAQTGSWSCTTGPDGAARALQSGATGMALLAMLRDGNTDREGVFKAQVDKGMRFLIVRQRTSKTDVDNAAPYEHAFATLALVDIYQRTKDTRFRTPSQIAVNFIVSSQDPQGGGWRYKQHEAGDLSVTGWQIQALTTAAKARLNVSPTCLSLVKRFLRDMQTDSGATYRYMNTNQYGPTAAMTAAGLASSIELDNEQQDPKFHEGVKRVYELGISQDPYQNYYVTRLLKNLGGAAWTDWQSKISEEILKTQERAGTTQGSWAPNTGALVGKEGGRLAQTAFNLLILLDCKPNAPAQ